MKNSAEEYENISQLAAASVCNNVSEEKNYVKVFKSRVFSKPCGGYKGNRFKFTHCERFWADPDVGLCLLDRWTLLFLEFYFESSENITEILQNFLKLVN